MSFVIIIGIFALLAGVIGAVRYARNNRPLALAYGGLTTYSMGMVLLWTSYAFRPGGAFGRRAMDAGTRAHNTAGANLLLELAWISILFTGLLLLTALREYTKIRVAQAMENLETVDRLDLLPPSPRKRRKKKRRHRPRSRSGNQAAETEDAEETEEVEETADAPD